MATAAPPPTNNESTSRGRCFSFYKQLNVFYNENPKNRVVILSIPTFHSLLF